VYSNRRPGGHNPHRWVRRPHHWTPLDPQTSGLSWGIQLVRIGGTSIEVSMTRSKGKKQQNVVFVPGTASDLSTRGGGWPEPTQDGRFLESDRWCVGWCFNWRTETPLDGATPPSGVKYQ
jgi:hypothetical protein